MIPHKGMAVAELVGGQITQKFGGTIEYHDGQTPPTCLLYTSPSPRDS